MDKLGLEEIEGISHSFITRSIAGAQDKIAAKVTVEQSASNMEEWVLKNLGSTTL